MGNLIYRQDAKFAKKFLKLLESGKRIIKNKATVPRGLRWDYSLQTQILARNFTKIEIFFPT